MFVSQPQAVTMRGISGRLYNDKCCKSAYLEQYWIVIFKHSTQHLLASKNSVFIYSGRVVFLHKVWCLARKQNGTSDISLLKTSDPFSLLDFQCFTVCSMLHHGEKTILHNSIKCYHTWWRSCYLQLLATAGGKGWNSIVNVFNVFGFILLRRFLSFNFWLATTLSLF